MTERKSLRRALNDEFSLSIPVYDENKASLSGVDRVSLEDELIRLRIETNRRNAAMIRNVEGMRDAISHLSSGKDPEEHLHKNANQNFSEPLKEKKTIGEILEKARKRALGGGIPGAAAMATQVFTLMWLRTTMNYQYKNGGGTVNALKTLYSEGGVRRFYRGLGPALFQGPLAPFGLPLPFFRFTLSFEPFGRPRPRFPTTAFPTATASDMLSLCVGLVERSGNGNILYALC
jgi:hypothetical protein